MIRYCRPSDASRICEIYNHYVQDTVITFEELPVPEADMAQRIRDVVLQPPWLVSEQQGSIVGCQNPNAPR